MTPVAPDQPAVDWLLKKRIEEASAMFRAVWDNYIKFYTVFLTFSLGALGWIIEHSDSQALRHSHTVIVIVFIGQSLLTSITSVAVSLYSRRTARELLLLEKALIPDCPEPPLCLQSSTIPVGIALWAGIANAVAMLGMIVECGQQTH